MNLIKMYLGSFLILLIIIIAIGLSIIPYVFIVKYVDNNWIIAALLALFAPIIFLIENKFYPRFEKIFDKIDKWMKR